MPGTTNEQSTLGLAQAATTNYGTNTPRISAAERISQIRIRLDELDHEINSNPYYFSGARNCMCYGNLYYACSNGRPSFWDGNRMESFFCTNGVNLTLSTLAYGITEGIGCLPSPWSIAPYACVCITCCAYTYGAPLAGWMMEKASQSIGAIRSLGLFAATYHERARLEAELRQLETQPGIQMTVQL